MSGLFERFRRRQFDKQFASHVEGGFGGNLYRGVFQTFAEAQASAPQGKPLGYDNPAAADLYLERTRRIYPSDYPVVYWLDGCSATGCGQCSILVGTSVSATTPIAST
jgi:hypothetical protein